MAMSMSKASLFLLCLWLPLLLCSPYQNRAIAEAARTLPSFPSQQSYTKVLATLGMVCKCCDGRDGECTNSWTGSCSQLQCLPWKLS